MALTILKYTINFKKIYILISNYDHKLFKKSNDN